MANASTPSDSPSLSQGDAPNPFANPADFVTVIAQYIKDFSFEGPQLPEALIMAQKDQPKIDMSVHIGVQPMPEDHYEVSLQVKAKAATPSHTLFEIELTYAGLFAIKNIPDEYREPLLLIYSPNLLFPFVRQVVATMTREAGFPPLMMSPIDFVALYQEQRARMESENATTSPETANGNSSAH